MKGRRSIAAIALLAAADAVLTASDAPRRARPDDYDRRQAEQDAHQVDQRRRPRPTGPAGRRIRARSRY